MEHPCRVGDSKPQVSPQEALPADLRRFMFNQVQMRYSITENKTGTDGCVPTNVLLKYRKLSRTKDTSTLCVKKSRRSWYTSR